MARQQPTRNITTAAMIPDKLYFRIGEVAKLCAVPAYVLRFWESEFPQLKPNKGGTGQRLYRRRDVEMALRVKTLLYDEGYTIAGARQAFKTEQKSDLKKDALQASLENNGLAPKAEPHKFLKLRGEMQDLLELLSKPAVARPSGATVQSIRATRPRRHIAESESGLLFAAVPPEPGNQA